MWVPQCFKLALTAGKETVHKGKREDKRKRKAEQGKVKKEELEAVRKLDLGLLVPL